MGRCRLDLQAIEQALRHVQRDFPKINEVLHSRRDAMTDEVIENIMAGYAFIDQFLTCDADLLMSGHLAWLLELNHLVLCGLEPQIRREYQKHLNATAQRFYEQEDGKIDHIMQWYEKHHRESAWKRAAGVYVRILSQPQLYIEGNHRTGALIMSYILAQEGKPPFVLTIENAAAYFNPSTLFKETKKTPTTLLMKLPGMKKRFANFLKSQASETFLRQTP